MDAPALLWASAVPGWIAPLAALLLCAVLGPRVPGTVTDSEGHPLARASA